MDPLSGIILGLVQGLTEFLPISSSGHLVLAREMLDLTEVGGLAFDAVLHFATALAVLIYFRVDIAAIGSAVLRRMMNRSRIDEEERGHQITGYAILIGTLPAVAFGLLLESPIETLFRNPVLVASALLAGSAIMFGAEYVQKRRVPKQAVTLRDGLVIGFFQALALIPGMSRSGMTISGGLFLGLSRDKAARFGFLLAVPIILGAGSKKLLDIGADGLLHELGVSLLLGAITAFCSGLIAIHYLLRYLRTSSLGIFIGYRIVLACVVLGVAFF